MRTFTSVGVGDHLISTGSSGRLPLPCSMAFIVVSATAVLSRSRRRAVQAQRRRPPRPPGPSPRARCPARWPPRRRPARRSSAGPAPAAGGPPAEGDQGDVVLLLQSGPVKSASSLSSRSISTSPSVASPVRAATRAKPNISPSASWASVIPSCGAAPVARLEGGLASPRSSMPGHQPQRHAGGPQLGDPVLGAAHRGGCGRRWRSAAGPVAGFRIAYRQVTNMWAGISSTSSSLTLAGPRWGR